MTSAAYATYFHVKGEFGVNRDDAVLGEIAAEEAGVLADRWIDIAKAHQGPAVARI